MGALDVAQVPVFQHGVNSAARCGEDIIELGAPAHFLAHGQGGPELFLRGEPLSAGLGYPATDVVEPRGELNQIQHGFLDAGPRRRPVRLPRLLDATRRADDEAPGRDASGGRDGDVDRIRRGVEEPVQLSRGLVAEHGALADAEDRGPQPRLARRQTAENGVDTPEELLPAAAFKAPADRLAV